MRLCKVVTISIQTFLYKDLFSIIQLKETHYIKYIKHSLYCPCFDNQTIANHVFILLGSDAIKGLRVLVFRDVWVAPDHGNVGVPQLFHRPQTSKGVEENDVER